MSYELVVCTFGGELICKVQMEPETLIAEIREQACVALSKKSNSDSGAVSDILLVSGTVIIDCERTCREAGFPFGGRAYCIVQSADVASVARAEAKRRRIMQDLDGWMESVQPCVSAKPFGTELATLMEAGLRAQRSAHGRMKLSWQRGVVSSSEEDTWSLDLCRQTVTVGDDVRSVETGGIEFRIGDRRSSTYIAFTTPEEFIEFWQAMSERRIAAYCIALKASGPGRARIQNSIRRSDLEGIARCPEGVALAV